LINELISVLMSRGHISYYYYIYWRHYFLALGNQNSLAKRTFNQNQSERDDLLKINQKWCL